LTAVLAEKSPLAYAGILAASLRGHGYVPLTPTNPAMRNRALLDQLRTSTLVVDSFSSRQLSEILPTLQTPQTILLPDMDQAAADDLANRFPRHSFVPANSFENGERFSPTKPDGCAAAYVLFTSGSTGRPKGVLVSHHNIQHFLKVVADLYGIGPEDRLTQWFELVFDLSLFDLFAGWDGGACVGCTSLADQLMPGRYIESCRPSIWFSVPSTALLMDQLRALEPGSLPDLRLSLFCGEALPAEIVSRWRKAAPNSIIENLYGPTEVTLACTRYRWRGDEQPADVENGLVPIGESFPGMSAFVVDADLREVPMGETGELLMSGPQVAIGYHEAPELTERAFVELPGRSGRYYRTGDRVRRPSPGRPLQYIGRLDHQIKVRGHRIELGEIECALREATGVQGVAAVGWPRTPGGADGIVAFVQSSNVDVDGVSLSLRAKLPRHMLPTAIVLVESLPMTINGKVDRQQLIGRYDQGHTFRPKRLDIAADREPLNNGIEFRKP
jgi:amino acid adenylation domain-containing protein